MLRGCCCVKSRDISWGYLSRHLRKSLKRTVRRERKTPYSPGPLALASQQQGNWRQRLFFSPLSSAQTEKTCFPVRWVRPFSSDHSKSKQHIHDTPSFTQRSQPVGLFRLLNDEERELVHQQRLLTARGRNIVEKVGLPAISRDNPLADTDASTDWAAATFRIVIAGEYNAGKSTLINALLGQSLLETGSLPTTDGVTIISQATATPETTTPTSSSVIHYRIQHSLLEDVTLIDTPGTNAVLQDHTIKTLQLLPTADLILFVTSADRPFPQSERDLLESISDYRKHIVIVINKMDILEQSGGFHGNTEKHRVMQFVTEHASDLLGAAPVVLAVSARDALASKVLHVGEDSGRSKSAVWERSQFAGLEQFLQESLTTETKIKAKLSSPIGVVQAAMAKAVTELTRQKAELTTDIRTVQLLESQWVGWRKEMSADLDGARREMVQAIVDQGERSWKVLQRLDSTWDFCSAALATEKTQSLAHYWKQTEPLTLNSHSSNTASTLSYETSENFSLHGRMLSKSMEIADSMAVRGRAHGQTMIESLGTRPSSRSSSLVGSVTAASRFEETRQQLAEHLQAAVRRYVDKTDQQLKHEQLLLSRWQHAVQMAYLSSAVGTMVSGAIVFAWPVLVTGSFAIQVALFGVGSVASMGLSSLLLGTSRWHAARQYAEHYKSVSQQLDEVLEAVASQELDRVHRRIQDGVAPYTRFVQAEQERIDSLLDECDDVVTVANQLRKRIAKIRS